MPTSQGKDRRDGELKLSQEPADLAWHPQHADQLVSASQVEKSLKYAPDTTDMTKFPNPCHLGCVSACLSHESFLHGLYSISEQHAPVCLSRYHGNYSSLKRNEHLASSETLDGIVSNCTASLGLWSPTTSMKILVFTHKDRMDDTNIYETLKTSSNDCTHVMSTKSDACT